MDINDIGLDDVFEQKRDLHQLEATAKTNAHLKRIADAEARRLSLPQCPWCGGRLEGQFELCSHCKSKIAWARTIPCKPGTEAAVLEKLRAEDKVKATYANAQRLGEQRQAFVEKKTVIDKYIEAALKGAAILLVMPALAASAAGLVSIGIQPFWRVLLYCWIPSAFWIILVPVPLWVFPSRLTRRKKDEAGRTFDQIYHRSGIPPMH